MDAVSVAKVVLPLGAIGLGGLMGTAMAHTTEEGFTPGQAVGTGSFALLAGSVGAASGLHGFGGTSGLIAGAVTGAGLIGAFSLAANLIPDGPDEAWRHQ